MEKELMEQETNSDELSNQGTAKNEDKTTSKNTKINFIINEQQLVNSLTFC